MNTIVDLTREPPHPSIQKFTFPDGQPHIAICPYDDEVNLYCRITNGDDLLTVLLAADSLREGGTTDIHLVVRYLMGARMDRRIDPDPDNGFYHPFTLKVITSVLETAGFATITLYDPHSDVAPALLDAITVLPTLEVGQAVRQSKADVLIAPDAGASKKVSTFGHEWELPVIQCLKTRDTHTGKLSGFRVVDSAFCADKVCLIVDDICDGGGTFAGIGELLKKAGAKSVHLYVTHGIFSKGLPIANIDHVYTTNSYQSLESTDYLTVIPETSC